MRTASLDGWTAFHIYYHADRDLLLRHVVLDGVQELVQLGLVDSFFFVRLSLGGPHVRLRLHAPAHVEPSTLASHLSPMWEAFRLERPSTESIDPERIREHNEYVRRFDPSESDDTVYADNSWRHADFVPETERYGGDDLIGRSLDYFCLSSLHTLRDIAREPSLSSGRRLTLGFRYLVRQAWGLANNEHELIDLIQYPRAADAVHAKADAAFERRRSTYLALLDRELNDILDGEATAYCLTEAGRRLSRAISRLPRERRRHICHSQLHMTANRLGLGNREETYLARLVALAVEDLKTVDPSLYRRALDAPAKRTDAPVMSHPELQSSLSALFPPSAFT